MAALPFNICATGSNVAKLIELANPKAVIICAEVKDPFGAKANNVVKGVVTEYPIGAINSP